MKLSPQELDFIESVQQTFRGDIGEPQDPTDPAYLHRWQVAQRNADYSLRDMLGQRRYDEYEEQANEQSAAQP